MQQLSPGEEASAEALAWGVSNIVIRIDRQAGDDFVIKQSRKQLRTQTEWFSQLERIWRELEVMQELQNLLPAGVVPRVLFEDRDNYLFAMEAIDKDHKVWKAELLDGIFDLSVASRLGNYLGAIHRLSFESQQFQERWSDWTIFDQLRIDPFYRFIVKTHPEIKDWVDDLIAEMEGNQICLVLADFSPKNILISGDQIYLVDFETAHYGDPAFDLGFFLSHLMLKAIYFRERGAHCIRLVECFWEQYLAEIQSLSDSGDKGTDKMGQQELERRTIRHLAACMLARVDGKSTVDYLCEPGLQDQVRSFALSLILDPPSTIHQSTLRLSEMQNS
ncbi:phosphotransferase family protein [Gimesia algae]|nr:aminoglycoside phosphotransferase family protein [Gimesia algae]